MDNKQKDLTENQNLDKLLEEALTEQPPENDVVMEITPFRKAMNLVLIGLALSTLTLDFIYLNYILPTIGIVMMLLGFRSLRRENGGFKTCWILSIVRVIYILPSLIINATIWQETILESPIVKTFSYIHIGIILLLIICMGFGFSSVQKKAGLKQHTGSVIALLIWYILLFILGMIQYNGLISGIALIITYFLIIRCLYRMASELEEAGYVIEAAPVRISDIAVILVISFILALGFVAAYKFFSKYPMQWTPVAENQDEEQAVKSRLITLGVPDTVAEDLTEDDLLDCTDAVRVVVYEKDLCMDQNGYIKDHDPKLHVTHVAVELPGSCETWKIIHHFEWNVNEHFYGTEAIKLWPKATGDYGWKMEGTYSGQVLFDDEDRTYASPFYSLREITFKQNSMFLGNVVDSYPFAMFSFPDNKKRYRGYVSFSIIEVREGNIIDSWLDYTHQYLRFQYPVQTAIESIIDPQRVIYDDVFKLMQSGLVFYPDKENP